MSKSNIYSKYCPHPMIFSFDTATGRHDFNASANVSFHCFPISDIGGIATIPYHLIVQRCDEVIENAGVRHLSHACYHTANVESRIFFTIEEIAIAMICVAIGEKTLFHVVQAAIVIDVGKAVVYELVDKEHHFDAGR